MAPAKLPADQEDGGPTALARYDPACPCLVLQASPTLRPSPASTSWSSWPSAPGGPATFPSAPWASAHSVSWWDALVLATSSVSTATRCPSPRIYSHLPASGPGEGSPTQTHFVRLSWTCPCALPLSQRSVPCLFCVGFSVLRTSWPIQTAPVPTHWSLTPATTGPCT